MNDEDWTEADDLVEEVWEARRKVWESCDNDVEKYIAHMQKLHAELVRAGWKEAPPPPPRQGKSAA